MNEQLQSDSLFQTLPSQLGNHEWSGVVLAALLLGLVIYFSIRSYLQSKDYRKALHRWISKERHS